MLLPGWCGGWYSQSSGLGMILSLWFGGRRFYLGGLGDDVLTWVVCGIMLSDWWFWGMAFFPWVVCGMMLLDWWFGGCCSYLGGLGDDVGETLGDGTGEDLLGGTGGGKSLFGIVGESLDWNKRCAQINYIRMDKMNSFYLHQNQSILLY